MSYGLPLVVVVMFASAAGVPTGVPIKVVLLLAGASLVDSWQLLLLAIIAMAIAELAGTMVLHLIARTGGVKLLEKIAAERQERVAASFEQWRLRLGGHDVAAIAVLRLIPFVRMGTTVGTGLLGINLRTFLYGSAIAAVIWTSVPLSLGYTFRSSIESLEEHYASVMAALPATLGIVVLLAVVGVLVKSAAARERLRRVVSRAPRALPLAEPVQETPPALG